jgi:hypothetical protein
VKFYPRLEAMPILDEAALIENLQPEIFQAANADRARMGTYVAVQESEG